MKNTNLLDLGEQNVEYLKSDILHQFNDKNSVLSYLMMEVASSESKYRSERWFSVKEKDLYFHVQCLNEAGQFIVKFVDEECIPKRTTVLDLFDNKSLSKEKHYFEIIEIKDSTIIFGSEYEIITIENNRLTTQVEPSKCIRVRFSSMNKYEIEDDNKMHNLIQQNIIFCQSNEVVYHRPVVTDNDIEKVKKFKTLTPIWDAKKFEELAKAFEHCRVTLELPMKIPIIEYLAYTIYKFYPNFSSR